MIESIFIGITALGILAGVVTEVVEPAAKYGWDKAKVGYEYVEDKVNPDA